MARKLHEGKMLKSFVSESVLREVSTGSENYSEKAKQSYATIIFSGIKNFKELQKNKTAIEIFDLMQKHLTVAADSVAKFGGEIDKMIEDKIMIVFEEKENDTNHAKNAINAALMTKQKMKELFDIDVAIGINSGITISGVMGAEKARLAHTVVGDPVNLAARLASEALKMDEAGIIISGNMISNLPENTLAEKLPINKVKGKTQSIQAYILRNC
jgi:adenylate cyclase